MPSDIALAVESGLVTLTASFAVIMQKHEAEQDTNASSRHRIANDSRFVSPGPRKRPIRKLRRAFSEIRRSSLL